MDYCKVHLSANYNLNAFSTRIPVTSYKLGLKTLNILRQRGNIHAVSDTRLVPAASVAVYVQQH